MDEPFQDIKILVADDLPSARKAIVRLLGKLGYSTVLEASDGEQALKIIEEGEVGLIISDWQMPKISGIDLVKKLRDAGNQIPFIIVTAASSREEVIEAHQSRVSDFIAKPFSMETLSMKIRRAVSSFNTSQS